MVHCVANNRDIFEAFRSSGLIISGAVRTGCIVLPHRLSSKIFIDILYNYVNESFCVNNEKSLGIKGILNSASK